MMFVYISCTTDQFMLVLDLNIICCVMYEIGMLICIGVMYFSISGSVHNIFPVLLL